MGRKRKWLKINEKFSTEDEWLKIYDNFIAELQKTGLTYKKEYKNETWFIVQVLIQQISGGWSSLIYGYEEDELNNRVLNYIKKYKQPMNFKVTINLEEWKEIDRKHS